MRTKFITESNHEDSFFLHFCSADKTHLQDSKQKGTPEWSKRKRRLYVKQVTGVVETKRTAKPDETEIVGVVWQV